MVNPLPSHSDLVNDLMPFSRIRLIITDLDGTLVNFSHPEIGGSFTRLKNALGHFKGKSVALTIGTGRTFAGAQKAIRSMGISSRIPLILYNGSVVPILANRTCLLHGVLQEEALREVIDLCQMTETPLRAFRFRGFSDQLPIEDVYGWGHVHTEVDNQQVIRMDSDTYRPPLNDFSAALIFVAELNPESIETLKLSLNGIQGLTATQSGPNWVELRPAGYDKGRALEVVAGYLGLSRSETAAIGDNDNDVELFRAAGIGVAVEGSSTSALAAAKYSCRLGVAQGAVELLRVIRESRRLRVSNQVVIFEE